MYININVRKIETTMDRKCVCNLIKTQKNYIKITIDGNSANGSVNLYTSFTLLSLQKCCNVFD